MFPYPTRCRTGGARARSGVSPAHGFWFLRGGRSGPMAGDLLVVWHPAPKSIARLRDAVLAGSADAGDPFPVRSLAAPDAGADDVEAAAATVIITTENFGALAGRVKDFLERTYPLLEERPNPRPGLPYLTVAAAAHSATRPVRPATPTLPASAAQDDPPQRGMSVHLHHAA